MNILTVSPSPHIKNSVTTQKIMLCVLISLLPAVIAGTLIFGLRALIVVISCTVSCVLFEYIARKIMKRENTISDLSASVTGVILALNLPPTIPIWVAVIGSFVAIAVTKQLFGGLGQNFANPAIVARIFLMLSFASYMSGSAYVYDGVSSATPLASEIPFSYKDLFFGTTGGCIGETCALALLIGGVFLIITRIISPSTPIAFLGTLALCTYISGGDALYQILSGGAMIGAFFMATDYVTTPITGRGKFIFGAGCGLITFLIRNYANYPEGVSFSILLMNLLTPYIDMITRTRPFGVKIGAKKEKA